MNYTPLMPYKNNNRKTKRIIIEWNFGDLKEKNGMRYIYLNCANRLSFLSTRPESST